MRSDNGNTVTISKWRYSQLLRKEQRLDFIDRGHSRRRNPMNRPKIYTSDRRPRVTYW